MLTVLRNAEVFAPDPLGVIDVWVAGGEVLYLGTERSIPSWLPPECVIDVEGMRVIPGLIDGHVHLTGGGGESGPSTRVPPLGLSRLTRAGITTCVGVLGTDGTTRTMRDLIANTLGLRELGLSAWCYTGSYQVPPITLTGSVRDDIVFIDPVIGVGELAISDHRSSQPTLQELLRIASDAYVAGLISNKAGVLHLHLGDGPRGLELVRKALDISEIPARVFHPTHVNRQRSLFEESLALSTRGVTVDVTAFPADESSFSASESIDRWLHAGGPEQRLTCSSDGAGCLPVFDENGRLVQMEIGQPSALSEALAEALLLGHDPSKVVSIFTSNVADVLGLKSKGRIAVGRDADFAILNSAGQIHSVLAGGRWMVRDGKPVNIGPFEEVNE